MITYQSLQKQYGLRIPKKFKIMLGDKINDDYCQKMLQKALQYNLTKSDYDDIYNKGNQSAKEYPGLSYLCCIYIHPITHLQALDKLVTKFEKLSKGI